MTKHTETENMHMCIEKYSDFSTIHVGPLRYFQVLCPFTKPVL